MTVDAACSAEAGHCFSLGIVTAVGLVLILVCGQAIMQCCAGSRAHCSAILLAQLPR